MSAPLDIEIPKAEDVVLTCTHQVSASDSTPVAITGWAIVFTAKYKDGASAYVVGPVTATITDGPNGTYTVNLVGLLDNVSEGVYPCDIWRTNAGAREEMGLGTLTITRSPHAGI